MRLGSITIVATVLFAVLASGVCIAQETEQDIINRYLKKTEEKHTYKLGWASVNFSMDRINRNNPYNSFATQESNMISGGDLNWLDQGYSFGADFGMVFKERFTWSIGGEYWLKQGDQLSGSYTYLPTGVTLSDPKSEIQVYGFSTGIQYYVYNPPKLASKLQGLAARVGISVGYYYANWDLFREYQNLNLATSAPTDIYNTTFAGSSVGFGVFTGIDYPLGIFDLAVGVDVGYLYLNFANVAWYNSQDEEVIATYTGDRDGRVDLDMSGVRGKVEIKRFFSW